MELKNENYYDKVLLATKYKLMGEILFHPEELILNIIEKVIDSSIDLIRSSGYDQIDWKTNLEHDLISFTENLQDDGKISEKIKFV
jgi:hypothetical protein